MNISQTSEETQLDQGKDVETSTAWRQNKPGWLISCCCCRGWWWRNIVCHFPPLCLCACGRATWEGHVNNTIRDLTGNGARYLSDKTINAYVSHQVHNCERFIRQQPLLSLAKYHTRVASRCVSGVCPPQANCSLLQEIYCWWNMRLMSPVGLISHTFVHLLKQMFCITMRRLYLSAQCAGTEFAN